MSLKLNLTASAVALELESGGKTEAYELREMSGAQRDAYLDSLKDRIRMDASGKPGVVKFEGMQADLVARCLFRQAENKAVGKEVVQQWPASVVTALYKEAQKLNGLNATEGELTQASKNV